MSVFETTTPISHRSLMNKSKDDLAREVMWRHNEITKLNRAILKFGAHTSDCHSPLGQACDCGLEEARAAANDWLAS